MQWGSRGFMDAHKHKQDFNYKILLSIFLTHKPASSTRETFFREADLSRLENIYSRQASILASCKVIFAVLKGPRSPLKWALDPHCIGP